MSKNDRELYMAANETAKAHYRDFEITRAKRKSNNRLLAEAGKHYVAFRLAAMGINPKILKKPEDSKGINIIAIGNEDKKVNIRVKTSAANNNSRAWDAGGNYPDSSKSYIYIFLNLWDDYPKREIECFVIPSEYVNAQLVLDRTKRPQFKFLKKDKDKEIEFLNNWALIKEQLIF